MWLSVSCVSAPARAIADVGAAIYRTTRIQDTSPVVDTSRRCFTAVLHCLETARTAEVLSPLHGVAEDGLLEEDEMSQLSGRTLDLRNSAALLKLARMSVDATAIQDSEAPICITFP